MRVVVASGKGGTGKTLLSTSLAEALTALGRETIYVDADVEEPNGHLFLHPTDRREREVTATVPALSRESCSGCGECQKVCAFGAIIALRSEVMTFDSLCHSCGACLLACPERALIEVPRRVGQVTAGVSGGLSVRWGLLDVGQPRGEPVLSELVSEMERDGDVIHVIDSAPGTSCMAVATARAADLAILVTEPTPFGAHDLDAALKMVEYLQLPVMAVINRADLGNEETSKMLERKGVPVIATIPFDREVARAYSKGESSVEASPALAQAVDAIASVVIERVSAQEVPPCQ